MSSIFKYQIVIFLVGYNVAKFYISAS